MQKGYKLIGIPLGLVTARNPGKVGQGLDRPGARGARPHLPRWTKETMLGSRGWGNREWVKLATVGSWINLFQQRMKCKKWMLIIWVFQEIICMHIQRKKRMAGNCSKPKHPAVFSFWHNKTWDTLSYNFWQIWWLTRRYQLGLSLSSWYWLPRTHWRHARSTCPEGGWGLMLAFFRVKMRPSFWSCKQLDCHNPCGNMSGISE